MSSILATLPTKPVEPNIPLVMALSIIFGLGAGIAFSFAAESLDNLIRSPEEVESLTWSSSVWNDPAH